MPDTFEPEAWSRLCEDVGGTGFIFRRSAEMAVELTRSFLRPGQRWLDAGCGTGQLVHALQKAGVWVVGVDHDPQMIQFARRSTATAFVVGRVEQIPFGNEVFDGVVATSLMGCVPNAQAVFGEVYRVLRQNGCAIITFTHRNSLLLKLNYLVRRPRGYRGYRLYKAGEVVRQLQQLAFQVMEVRFYNFVFCVGNWLLPPAPFARRLHSNRSWCLARNFVVVLRKQAGTNLPRQSLTSPCRFPYRSTS